MKSGFKRTSTCKWKSRLRKHLSASSRHGIFVAYPLELAACLENDLPWLAPPWEIDWRRGCAAWDTCFDTRTTNSFNTSGTRGFRPRSPSTWGATARTTLVYAQPMETAHEIEAAISKLSRQKLLALRDWFSEFDSAAWDKQFEEDVATGRLDGLADGALADLRDGRCREM